MSKKLKALMTHDWFTMKVVYIALIVMIVSGSFMTFSQARETGTAGIGFSAFIGAFAVMLLVTSFASDDTKNIGVTRRTMPYSDKEMVLSRYIPVVVVVLAVALFTVITSVIGGAMHGFAEGFAGQLLFCIALEADVILIMPIIFYPFIFRYGYQKLQTAYSLVTALYMLAVFSGFMIMMIVPTENGASTQFMTPDFEVPVIVSIIDIAVMVGLTVLSLRSSVKQLGLKD
ncbi:ABC-2 transporter permease [Ruminococcus sp.]|uniref:ABC-2 transporter permease n=1 Tax=Ruminococcus sp. TaxID=41978 RepID=UPI0025FCDDF7|nr:ABC-2 transporter permease [Ruminococcus sp.]MBQ8965001.1 ABC-2 transporter permease [Ruminococcus sp.]